MNYIPLRKDQYKKVESIFQFECGDKYCYSLHLKGNPIRNLIMCPCDVPLTQKFMCDEDCVYCGKEEAEIKTESVRKS